MHSKRRCAAWPAIMTVSWMQCSESPGLSTAPTSGVRRCGAASWTCASSASTDVRARLALWLDLIRWNRPAGWLLLLWPTLSALWIAAHGFPGWHLLAVFVFGTILMRSAGVCVNDVADRRFDRHVQRTASRPVTSGMLPPREALLVGAMLALS